MTAPKEHSAQPSPGGEGDAWDIAELVRTDLDRQSCPDAYMRIAMESVVKHLAARQPVCNYEIQTENGPLKCSLAVYAEWQKNEEYIARLEEELKSARQPVGEPVAVVATSERFTYGKLNRDLPDGTNLYAAPPAQAVDVGQFVPDPKTVPDCFAEDDSDAQYNSGWNDCRDAVLALIDSKAS